MGMPNRDEMEGKYEKTKGSIKEKVGQVAGDRELEDEGRGDRAEGNVQEGFGKARRKVGDAIKDVGDRIRD